jgi:ElaB/YqjD/DUF883 family membrane-anchored ribosome-binding protein
MQNTDNTAKARSGMSQEFHDFLADIETLLKESAVLSGEELSTAKVKIQEKIASAKASAVKFGDSLSEGACKMAETTNQKVHAEPWKAVGAGAFVGVLIGLLFARR